MRCINRAWIKTILLLLSIGLMGLPLAGCGGGGGGGGNSSGNGEFTGNISGEWEIIATPDPDTLTGVGNCNRPEPYTYQLTFSRNGNLLMIEDMELQQSWTGTMDGNRCSFHVTLDSDGVEIIIDAEYQFTSDTTLTASASVQGDNGQNMCAWEENQRGRRVSGGTQRNCVSLGQGRWDFEFIRADTQERLQFNDGQLSQNGCIVTFIVDRSQFTGELTGNRWSGDAVVWDQDAQQNFDFTFNGAFEGDPLNGFSGTWIYSDDNAVRGDMRGSRE